MPRLLSLLAALASALVVLESTQNMAVNAMNVPALQSRTLRAPPPSNYQHFHRPSVELSLVDPIVRSRSYNSRPSRLPAYVVDYVNRGKIYEASQQHQHHQQHQARIGVRERRIVLLNRMLRSPASSEAVLNDPRFVNCMGEVGGPDDPNFVAVFAKCYSFAGRPRFGKRGWRPSNSAFEFPAEYNQKY